MGDFADGDVAVRSPASTANLGPGLDSLGLCLAWHDEVRGRVVDAGLDISVSGEGADRVALDESHLMVSAMRTTFDRLGASPPGLRLRCVNRVPHGRGLGSSAAAIVSGIRLAEALVDGARLTDGEVLTLAAGLEGHPDNVAACLFGGLTVVWGSGGQDLQALRLEPHPDLRPVVFVSPYAVSTHSARQLLPQTVPHSDAVDNGARTALLVAALTQAPGCLLPATEDRLHQEYRRPAMPETLELVDTLRDAGVPAVVSGAGPSVLAVGTRDAPVDPVSWTPSGWCAKALAVSGSGAVVQFLEPDRE
jgi:homoserine kinase